ncbi:MAG: DUF6359 domain-containing protein [Bacteroidales bacterium]
MKTKFRSFLWLAMATMISFSSCSNVDDDVVDPDNGGGVTIGDGSEAKPFNVDQAIKNQGQQAKWIEGYIVGGVSTANPDANEWQYAAPFATPSNILIAAKAGETDNTKIIAVQLLIGDIRDFINLVNNPAKLGTKVKLHGNLEKYFGIAGLKGTDQMVAEGFTPKPVGPGAVEVCGDQTTVPAGYKYDFNNVVDKTDFSEAGWQNVTVQGSRKWQGKIFEGNGYIQATAHGATANQIQESWVISPAFDVTAASVKMVSFETAQGYWKDDTKFEVFVLQCKDGKTVQTKVTPSALPTSATPNYQFVPATVDLSGFTGKVFIGFRYEGMGGQSLSTTWCLDNFAFGVAPSTETTVAISSAAVASVTTGAAYSYAVKTAVVNGKGNTTITATGLPAWATLVDNGDGTATISGTAPATEESSNVVVKATNNNITAEQAYTLTVVKPVVPGANILVNGNFEDWTGDAPASWSFKAVTGVTYEKNTQIVQSSTNSIKVVSGATSGTASISANRVKLTPGDYVYTFYYYIDPAVTVANTFRAWGMIYDNETTTAQSTDAAFNDMKKLVQPSGYVDASVKGQWVKNEIAFTVPKDCYMIFDVRVYKGTIGFVDSVSLIQQ